MCGWIIHRNSSALRDGDNQKRAKRQARKK